MYMKKFHVKNSFFWQNDYLSTLAILYGLGVLDSSFLYWPLLHGGAYMPCLTLWDKISQNLAHLEANSLKIFKSHRIFRPSYSTSFEEINKLFHLNIDFWLCWRSSKVIFVKISQNFIKISLKNLPYLTDFSPQLMACMAGGGGGGEQREHCLLSFFISGGRNCKHPSPGKPPSLDRQPLPSYMLRNLT